MTKFAPFIKNKNNRNNKGHKVNILNIDTSANIRPTKQDALSRVLIKVKDTYLASLDDLFVDKKLDSYFNLPQNNIEYLSNHIDDDRPNFREFKVLENFLQQDIESLHKIKLKHGATSILDSCSYFVCENTSTNWGLIPVLNNDILPPTDTTVNVSFNFTETNPQDGIVDIGFYLSQINNSYSIPLITDQDIISGTLSTTNTIGDQAYNTTVSYYKNNNAVQIGIILSGSAFINNTQTIFSATFTGSDSSTNLTTSSFGGWLKDYLFIGISEPTYSLITTPYNETPTEPPTEPPTDYFKITKNQIKVFKVNTNSPNLDLTDITQQILEPIVSSDYDETISKESCHTESQTYECDDSSISLPEFFSDPLVTPTQDAITAFLSPYKANIYINILPSTDVGNTNYIQPLYEDGPSLLDLQSSLANDIDCSVLSTVLDNNQQPTSVEINGETNLNDGTKIQIQAIITNQQANGTLNIVAPDSFQPSSLQPTNEILTLSFNANTNSDVLNATLLATTKSGFISSFCDINASMVMSKISNEQIVKKQKLLKLAEDYAKKYRATIDSINYNSNNIRLKNLNSRDLSYIKQVHKELDESETNISISADSFASIDDLSFNPIRKTGRFGEPIKKSSSGFRTPEPKNMTSRGKAYSNPELVYKWHLDRVNQTGPVLDKVSSTHINSLSQNAVVYVFDTGVDIAHPEFENRAFHGFSVFGSHNDVYGHGTHVAGTIAGKTVGIAKKATIISVKVLSDLGSGSYFGIIDGINWAINDIQRRKAIDPNKYFLANFSLGGGRSNLLNRAINELSKYCEVFASAGNSSVSSNSTSPASAQGSYGIGASDILDGTETAAGIASDKVAFFSNWGERTILYAPGVNIFSCVPGNRYMYASGTSMSCPLACGLFAIDPNLFDNAIKDELYCIPRFKPNPTDSAYSIRTRSVLEMEQCRRINSMFFRYSLPQYDPDGNPRTDEYIPPGRWWRRLAYTNATQPQPRPGLVDLEMYPSWPPPETLGDGSYANYGKHFDWKDRECWVNPTTAAQNGYFCDTFYPPIYDESARFIFIGELCNNIWDSVAQKYVCNQDNVSTVGSNGNPSHYGTYDQNGNVNEYVERKSEKKNSEDTGIVLLRDFGWEYTSLIMDPYSYNLQASSTGPLFLESRNRTQILNSDDTPLNYIDLVYGEGLIPYHINSTRVYNRFSNVMAFKSTANSAKPNYLHVWEFDEKWKLIRKRQGIRPSVISDRFRRALREFVPDPSMKWGNHENDINIYNQIKPLNLTDATNNHSQAQEYWAFGTALFSVVGGGSHSEPTSSSSIPSVESDVLDFELERPDNVLQIVQNNSFEAGFRIVSKSNPYDYPYFVTVGDVNNQPHEVSGFGAVDYEFKINKYLVTNDEYCEFLNSFDGGGYNPKMMYGHKPLGGTIDETGIGPRASRKTGIYRINNKYIVNEHYGNKPAIYVPFLGALRYCNWLHQGRPRDNWNSDEGAYHITRNNRRYTIYKEPRGLYHLPTIDEWYKAAYYKGDNS